MPAENGLPQYVSKNARSGFYQNYRRPPVGVSGAAFVRSFGSKDRKTVSQKYAAIHAEAEAYFERLIKGRPLTDDELKVRAIGLVRFILFIGNETTHPDIADEVDPEYTRWT